MNRSLPYPPSLVHLRHEAKSILKDHKRGNAAAVGILRQLRRFVNASDQQILSSELALHEVQFALAVQYGFKSWDALKRHVLFERSESMPSHVHTDGTRVWIEGVPDPGVGARGDCSFAGALSAALEVTKRPFSYADIMGYSGVAFRVRWFQYHNQKGWCPSSCVAEFGPEIRAVERCTGWKLSDHWAPEQEEDDPQMEHHTGQIAQSIRSGMPMIGYPRFDNWNVGVAFGYESDGDTVRVLWKDYFSKELSVPTNQLGSMLVFLTDESSTALSPADAFIHAIGGRWWRDETGRTEHSDKGYYLMGERALTRWQEDIAAVDQFNDEQRKQLFFVSWWCYVSLLDARRNAVKFLNANAAQLEGDPRSLVEQASRMYQDEVKLLSDAFEARDAFLGPWTGKDISVWDAGMHQREVDLLVSVRELDARADELLQRAAQAAREPAQLS